jgi:SAM-dependent methyltransferase
MSEVLGDTVLQSRVLEDLSEAVHYRRWLSRLALPYLGDRPIEIGSGTGDYAAAWADLGVPQITASEADPYRLGQLTERFAVDPRVDVLELVIPLDIDADFTSVVAYNVLEHIPDDVDALRGFRRLLAPGGRVVLIVPAFEFAMSRFDREIGHQRRYRLSTMRAALERAGLQVEVVRYVNPVGLLAWVVAMRLLRMRPSAGPLLRGWDGLVVPVAERLERNRRPPFGQSVFAVARRPVE